MSDTEFKLKMWRGDQIGSERLSAAVLIIDGFSSVDPQCPLGGPDGLKDVICEKNDWKYIGAAYFPIEERSFTAIEEKFLKDLPGVKKNAADGFVFITNQRLTPTERDNLVEKASQAGHKCIIYHVERLRAILDSPAGYGARFEYLDIEMSREEQFSYFAKWDQRFADRLNEQATLIIRALSSKIDAAKSDAAVTPEFLEVGGFIARTIAGPQSDTHPRSNKRTDSTVSMAEPTSTITAKDLRTLHAALLFESPRESQVGELRKNTIWIAGGSRRIEDAAYVPPSPELVPSLIDDLLTQWRNGYSKLSNASEAEKVDAITRFHHRFLKIHPFVDGNGRLARFLLWRQAVELLGISRRIVIEDKRPYFDAIQTADGGDFGPLSRVISQAIFGSESVNS